MTFRALAASFSALFVSAAAVQLNDPDPMLWIGVYLSAAAWSGAAALGRRLPWPATALLLVAYLAMGSLWLGAFEHTSLQAFGSIGMSSVAEEEVREAWGLAICIAWTAVLLVQTLRVRSRSKP